MTIDKWALRARSDERGKWCPICESRGHDASNYLSEESDGENWHPYDVLRFALEGRLALVLDIAPGTKDVEGRPIERGPWDLPMEGAARQQVDHDYRLFARLSPINIDGIEGAWVERDGDRRQLDPMSSGFCYPQGRLEALDTLLKKTPPADARDRPLGERERTTLLSIIAALAKKAKIDLSHPSTAAARIEEMTGRLGVRVAARTAEDHLKKVCKLLDERGTYTTWRTNRGRPGVAGMFR